MPVLILRLTTLRLTAVHPLTNNILLRHHQRQGRRRTMASLFSRRLDPILRMATLLDRPMTAKLPEGVVAGPRRNRKKGIDCRRRGRATKTTRDDDLQPSSRTTAVPADFPTTRIPEPSKVPSALQPTSRPREETFQQELPPVDLHRDRTGPAELLPQLEVNSHRRETLRS